MLSELLLLKEGIGVNEGVGLGVLLDVGLGVVLDVGLGVILDVGLGVELLLGEGDIQAVNTEGLTVWAVIAST